MPRRVASLLISLFIAIEVFGQDPVFTGTTANILTHNPSFAGLEGGHILRTSYTSLFPSSGFGLSSYFAQWSGNFDAIHGGVNLWAKGNELGDVYGQITGGASYSYHLQIARNLFAAAGLSVSVINTQASSGSIIFQDQIDPVYGNILPGSESFNGFSKGAFNISTGGVLFNDQFFVSWSVDHLNKPDLTGLGFASHRLNRTGYGFASYRYTSSFKDIAIIPSFFSTFRKGDYNFVQAISLEMESISVNGGFSFGKERPTGVQCGLGYLNSSYGFIYTYRFNPGRGDDKVLPTTTFHEVGVVIRLQSVDKRNIRQTINFPKL